MTAAASRRCTRSGAASPANYQWQIIQLDSRINEYILPTISQIFSQRFLEYYPNDFSKILPKIFWILSQRFLAYSPNNFSNTKDFSKILSKISQILFQRFLENYPKDSPKIIPTIFPFNAYLTDEFFVSRFHTDVPSNRWSSSRSPSPCTRSSRWWYRRWIWRSDRAAHSGSPVRSYCWSYKSCSSVRCRSLPTIRCRSAPCLNAQKWTID